MTAEVTVKNGRAEMAFRGDTPWHGLGNELRDDMTWDEKAEAAGFNWHIEATKVRYHVGRPPKLKEISDKLVLYRSDDEEPLSVVSKDFKITQPRDVLNYFQDLTEKFELGQLETAGTLFGGKQFWALANLGEMGMSVLDEKDKLKPYVLFATSCDRSIANTIKFLSMRVVCKNTLSIGLSEKGGTQVKQRHRKEFDPEMANKELGLQAKAEFEQEMEIFRELAKTRMSEQEMVKASMQLYRPKVQDMTADELKSAAKAKGVRRVSQLAIGHDALGDELNGVHGTLWGWLNSVTEYVDWDNGSEPDRRLNKAWHRSTGMGLKEQAFALAKDMTSGKNDNLIRKAWAIPDDELRDLALS
jgi:phage/plasmid-like protein (TIGR03299 family)